MNLIDPVEWLHIVMSVLCPKPYDLESDYLPYLLLYKRTYLEKNLRRKFMNRLLYLQNLLAF